MPKIWAVREAPAVSVIGGTNGGKGKIYSDAALTNQSNGGMMKITNAAGKIIDITDKNDLKDPPNGITQTTNKRGGIDRNYYIENVEQTKQISNNDHGHKKESFFGNHGEHAHGYSFNDKGINVHGKPRELTDEERKENADIL